jgi:hypothetical protein
MESNSLERRILAGLPIMANVLNYPGDVGFKLGKQLNDFVKPLFMGGQTGPQRSAVNRNAITDLRLLPAAFQHRIKTPGLPAESYGQRFQRAGATPPLHGMTLDLPHDGHRHMRTLRKLTLTPAELADALADRPGDSGPVFRHAFRHARSSAFRFHRRD